MKLKTLDQNNVRRNWVSSPEISEGSSSSFYDPQTELLNWAETFQQ